MASRIFAMASFNVFYKRIKQNACIYCGLRATTLDHFVPISVVDILIKSGADVQGKFLLPSCGECNSICGARIFKTVASKRRYVQERLVKKYNKVLSIPNWDQKDLEGLSWSLKSYVLAGMAQKSVLLQRIAWRNTSNATYVEIAKIRFGLLASGQNTVVGSVNNKAHTKDVKKKPKFAKKKG